MVDLKSVNVGQLDEQSSKDWTETIKRAKELQQKKREREEQEEEERDQ